MTVLKGHFDGKSIVLHDPAPGWLTPNTPVAILVGEQDAVPRNGNASALDAIARLARPLGLPPDFAEQHDHYTRGTPKR